MDHLDELLSVWEHRKENGETISADDLCREHPELLEEVRWHIRALEAVELQFGNTDSQIPETAGQRDPSVAARINQEFQITNTFQINQHHASGGLGDVFVATDPVLNRQVAIKFPRATRLSAEQLARFEREARITGQLDHPGIVAVHSLKIADESQPCYVMRFVKGPTLQESAREFHETWESLESSGRFASREFRQLLQHFVALCNIVAYAHDQGVIHRDIKPANVILGPFGQTLLMDWGLARVDRLDQEMPAPDENVRGSSWATDAEKNVVERLKHSSHDVSTDVPFSTRTGQVLGTPAFASPEQLLGLSDQIDHRSDVFSLGASLYYVLTGKLPVELPNSAEYLQRISNQQESLVNCPTSVPRPLAAICRAATHISPTLRYQNPLALAQDLQSFLASESISVLADSSATKMLRWMGKHRAASVTASLATLILLLVSGIGLALLSANNQKLETANVAERGSRAKAEQNFSTAREAVQEFLVRTTENEKLQESDFTDLRKELLDSATPFYQRLRSQEPGDQTVEANRADALYRLGSIQKLNGELESARATFKECISTYQQLSQQHPTVAQYQRGLADGHSILGSLMRDFGKLDQALIEYDLGRSIDESLVRQYPDEPEYQMGLATTYNNLATVAKDQGDRTEARNQYQLSFDIWQSLANHFPAEPEYQIGFSQINNAIGILLTSLGEYKQAIEFHERGIQVGSELVSRFPLEPDYGFEVSSQQVNLGLLFKMHGRLDEGRQANETALATLETLAENFPTVPKYQQKLGMCLNTLGSNFRETRNYETAQQHFLQALVVRTKLAANYPANPRYRFDEAVSLNNLGMVMINLNDPKSSQTYHEQALKIRGELVRQYPDEAEYRRWWARSFGNLAALAKQRGDLETAGGYLQDAVDAGKQTVELMPDVPDAQNELAEYHQNLASVLGDRGLRSEAQLNYQLALAIREQLVEQYSKISRYRLGLGGNYCNFGNFETTRSPLDSLSCFEKAETALQVVLADEPENLTAKTFLTNTYLGKAQVLHGLARYAEAVDNYERALEFDSGRLESTIEQGSAQSRAMVEQAAHWDELLVSGDSPTDVKQQLDFAKYCYHRSEFQRAAHEYKTLFATNPDEQLAHGYDAACCAILAALGKAVDNDPLTIEESAEWRSQGLTWLQRELANIIRGSDDDSIASLTHWLADADLESVRENVSLNSLTETERQNWESFWLQVREAIAGR